MAASIATAGWYNKSAAVQGNLAARKSLHELAKQGNAEARLLLGQTYEYGTKIMRRDPSEAFFWYIMAAQQGHDQARFHTGLMYERGIELVTQDAVIAKKWYKLAAIQGNTDAIHALLRCNRNWNMIQNLTVASRMDKQQTTE